MSRTLTVAGVVHAMTPVSAAQVAAYATAHEAAEGRPDQADRQAAALETLLRHAFPYRWSMLWRGDPVRRIKAITDPAVLEGVLAEFFRWVDAAVRHPRPR